MKQAWAICRRECRAFFATPVGYVVLATYALITGLGFTASFSFYALMSQSPSTYGLSAVPNFEETFLSPYLVYCGTVMMFLGPLITMRLLAEERAQGTIEMLYTHPLRDRDIVFGKFGAAVIMLCIMMLMVMVNLVFVYRHAEADGAVLALGLLGTFLMGCAFLSMGLFVSALCRSQITAATLAFGLFFLFFLLGYVAEELPEGNPAPESWPAEMRQAAGGAYGFARAVVAELPIDSHAKTMAQGILQPHDIVYYVLFIGFFLFLTFRALDSRRWSGAP